MTYIIWHKTNEILPSVDSYYLGYCPEFENPFVIIKYDADLGGFLDYDSEVTNWAYLESPSSKEIENVK